MITYEMSRKIANTSWVQLAFSGCLVLGICVFHQLCRQVILVQLVLMVILLVMVALPLLQARNRSGRGSSHLSQPARAPIPGANTRSSPNSCGANFIIRSSRIIAGI